MRHNVIPSLLVAACLWLPAAVGSAQIADPPASGAGERPIQAIDYPVGWGSIKVDFRNAGLIANAAGEARVEAKTSGTTVVVRLNGFGSPARLGPEFLTYVLWALSPQGRAINLGGIPFDRNGRGKLRATTLLQSFSLLVTAEPYFAVRQPSEMLVLENVIRTSTGRIFAVANYRLMKRSEYRKPGSPLVLIPDVKNVPLEMYEARNAVAIARSRAADKYAPDIFMRAQGTLSIAEHALSRHSSRKEVVSAARLTAQFAEDARALSVERQEQERIAAQRAAAAAWAKADAEARAAELAAETRRRAEEDARQHANLSAARQAQIRAEAAARETRMRAQAEIAATRARVIEEATQDETDRLQRAAVELRARLFDQFNKILETRDSPRGLIVTMADVLFDTGKNELRMAAREKLARFAGIVLAHPGLRIQVEGHTDNTRGDERDVRLSWQRAEAVRNHLVRQTLAESSITAFGYGKELPVAENTTAAGKPKSTRVELVVLGEVIGIKMGSN